MTDRWRQILILFLIALVTTGIFVLASDQVYRTGYPLDDAWIHQTFARNLIRYQQLSYFQGIPSAGSTAPLWTAALSLGYLVFSDNYFWTMLLGVLSLFLLGWLGEQIFRRITPGYNSKFPWAGTILILDWHFIWAAASGMETLLFADICLAVLLMLLCQPNRWFWIGILIGIGVWVRPDAILLAGPAIFVAIVMIIQKRADWKIILILFTGFLVLSAPYLAMNDSITGSVWPNTFFAKQAEYRELLQKPLPERLWVVFQQHIVGIGILLLPGFAYKILHIVRTKDWVLFSFLLWWSGFLLMYALRLPVNYQHGRYEIPVMPFFLLFSGSGVFSLFMAGRLQKSTRIITSAWAISIFLVLLSFFGLGARSYAIDVAIIESEMVQTAKWIERNTPPDALIAAHDIGALGFFGNRPILDLAGLVSPEVIPMIRDEGRLFTFIRDAGADYLMTFPGWYPVLTQDLDLVFSSGGQFSPQENGENMKVFQFR